MTTLPTQVRFRDLKARGIVRNWVTLRNWVNTRGFPQGRKPGGNTRTWTEDEIAAWLATCPVDTKPWPSRRVDTEVDDKE
jgi:predicted DNA-binding transcriptional regulator AlpA